MKITEKITDILIQNLIQNEIIRPDDSEIYSYGLKQLFRTFIVCLPVIIIAAIIGHLIQCIILFLAFIPLRSYAGGFHAKSPVKCYFISVGILLASILTIRCFTFTPPATLIIIASTALIITKFAPVDTENKTLDDCEKIIYKTQTRSIFAIEIAIIVIFTIIPIPQIADPVLMALLNVCFLILTSVFLDKR